MNHRTQWIGRALLTATFALTLMSQPRAARAATRTTYMVTGSSLTIVGAAHLIGGLIFFAMGDSVARNPEYPSAPVDHFPRDVGTASAILGGALIIAGSLCFVAAPPAPERSTRKAAFALTPRADRRSLGVSLSLTFD
jgi:hypothetical protein